MSHSRIYQIAKHPIGRDKYSESGDFYDNGHDFADYIGDEREGDDRKEDIEALADTVSDLFTLDKEHDALVYRGEDAMMAFRKAWADAIHKQAAEITADNVLDGTLRYHVRATCNETHLRTPRRVCIEDWNGYAGPMDDLVEYTAYEKLKAGDRLYIGAVIDYHY